MTVEDKAVEEESEELKRLRESVCGHKQKHDHPKAARAHARSLEWNKHEHVTPYRCPFCKSWHVGHPPSMKTVEKIALAIRGLL
jgi:hypothetical protein